MVSSFVYSLMAMAMEEEHCGSEEEELDAALESVLVASLTNHNLFNAKPSAPSRSITASSCSIIKAINPGSETMPLRLTFSFPGWGVDISRDLKRRRPSVFRHTLKSAEEGVLIQKNVHKQSQNTRILWSEEARSVDGCPIFEVPDEVLSHVFMKLEMRDLCSVMQTCQRWHALGFVDDLWERFGPPAQGLNNHEAVNFPRWLFVKNYTLSSQISNRYTYFRKGYDHLRSALYDWWELGRADGRYSSSAVHSLIRKLTAQDWSLVYEAFGAAFSHRTDFLASILIRALEKAQTDRIGLSKHVPRYQEQKTNAKVLTKSFETCKVFMDDGSINYEFAGIDCDNQALTTEDGPAGKELWNLLYNLWNRYKCWLTLIFNHSADLNHEVMVERARGAAFSATPTVYDKGVISFRNWMYLMTTLYVRKLIHN
ncbi:hypothetical protein O6H91_07G091600 [Diphasiastrum complanatum]|uniref:Uncharacterized protein n=1 Tax=Diphasiastrum complanatum TaxID=34168 RepID=A0ACC2D7G8_DIPCM|nr:hypothetical protein O6H91_07G091600 [Diphasiastrum complanatum]